MTVQRKAGYIQSLPKYLTLCERNYANVLRILPEQQCRGASRLLDIRHERYQVDIEQMAKYTTDICITQVRGAIAGMFTPPMNVRIYHDARVAEVVHPDYHSRIKPTYSYPNAGMHQKDEKYQVNAFLHDWLTFCISHGEAVLDWDCGSGLV
ncbi:DUF1249 domain-containing protein [Pseudoalteromonas sp. BDTF-M6]|uniref:DUF1249 domain-containing protein n=1 Tax=Pseudoalteromonas sp. BDTF-M6 TaxID=2796132 RepID=UPI001BAF9016|nr:DUF1249 domain-containing protein [Pseudoalteromonas sp. BDTF-M6]